MVPSLRARLAALTRGRRPRPNWRLGMPVRASIVAAACGGYLLRIDYTDGREWLDLPRRADAYDRPDEREFTAATRLLAERGLTWALPWQIGQYTPVTPIVRKERTRHGDPELWR